MESEVSRDESNLSPYLPARSRLPLCLPEDANMEMALAPESPKIEQQSQKTLVVEVVSLRPIEKFRRAVAKMPRVSLTVFKTVYCTYTKFNGLPFGALLSLFSKVFRIIIISFCVYLNLMINQSESFFLSDLLNFSMR